MSDRASGPKDERGETLLELVISIAIMGVIIVPVMGGLATGVLASGIQREQATAGVYARDYAEAIENSVSGTGYAPCAPAAIPNILTTPPSPSTAPYALATVGLTAPPGFVALGAFTTTAALTWIPLVVNGIPVLLNGLPVWSWAPCTTDNGNQQVTVKVVSDDGRAFDTLNVILRSPCRSTDPGC